MLIFNRVLTIRLEYAVWCRVFISKTQHLNSIAHWIEFRNEHEITSTNAEREAVALLTGVGGRADFCSSAIAPALP